MQTESPVFQKTCEAYSRQVAGCDLSGRAGTLAIQVDNTQARLKLFNRWFTITPEKVADSEGKRPPHTISVLLCKYLLLCPEAVCLSDKWMAYKDFKDAAPFVIGFGNTVEKPIARHFSGRLNLLATRCEALGGMPIDSGGGYQLACRFQALPRVPVYLLFNDRDEEFPAECKLIFEKSASDYMDMECIAMLGSVLAEWLKETDGVLCARTKTPVFPDYGVG